VHDPVIPAGGRGPVVDNGVAVGQAVVTEETLDPASWDDIRTLSHLVVDDMIDYVASLRDRPCWTPMPDEVRERFAQPLPVDGEGAEAVYQDFREIVLPYVTGNAHPRFWGWVCGNGSPIAVLAELLAATVNSSVDGFDDSGTMVEAQVIRWIVEMLGWRAQASGLLVSGCSMANLVGLAVARNTIAPVDVRRHGVPGSPRLLVYGSDETHSSIQKAVQILGLGTTALRAVRSDDQFRIDVDELESKIAEDVAAGHVPLAIVGTVGTVNTGAIDDLDALAQIATRHGAWLHVDGAFGACAALSGDLRPRLSGLEKADSLAFDLHKWMYFPYEAGCVLVRSDAEHRAAFSYDAPYMAPNARGLAAARSQQFTQYGPQLSRGFRALKIWMGLKEQGADKFRRLIEQNVNQAYYLASLIEDAADLELLAPVSLNVVCFRYRPAADGFSPQDLDRLNEELLFDLQESGIAVASHTRLRGRYALRVAVTNHRSRREDFEVLARAVQQLGTALLHDGVEA
jgi:glutamate/tyrosine decarboxylase-like PLP-dependent enzyme